MKIGQAYWLRTCCTSKIVTLLSQSGDKCVVRDMSGSQLTVDKRSLFVVQPKPIGGKCKDCT